MARTVNEIYDEIIAEKEAQTTLNGLLPAGETSTNLLNDLTSGSKVAVWRLWAYTIAVAIYIHEVLWDKFKLTIEKIAANAPAGTPRWYQKKMFEFQFGDLLQYVNNQYIYDPIDESKRIVTRCAIEERADGVVIVKAAKTNMSGQNEPLTQPEIDALESYADKIKFAGTRLAVLSIPADQLGLTYDIYFDPLTPLVTVQQNVQAAVDAHIASLEFNGALNITRLTDSIQRAVGVADPVFQTAFVHPSGGVQTVFEVEAIPAAGWFQLDDTVATMFNWIPTI